MSVGDVESNRAGGAPRSSPRSPWDLRLQELLEFRKMNGHLAVPRGWAPNPRLANWVNNQRRLLRLGLLPAARVRRLRECGVSWEGLEARREAQQEAWDRMFGALRTFRRCYGHLNVPRAWKVEPALAAWLASQRYLFRSGGMIEARRLRLGDLDPDWFRTGGRSRKASSGAMAPPPSPWERRLAALRDYRRRFGTCEVPPRWAEDPGLPRWVSRQRLLRRRGKLPAGRIRQLDELGFVWSGLDRLSAIREGQWEAWVVRLSRFLAAHGHARVPLRGSEGLGAWLSRQRRRARRGALPEERARKLEALGAFHSDRDRVWNEALDQYLRMKARSGEPSPSRSAVERRRLYRWISVQRAALKSGRLAPARRHRLEEADGPGKTHPGDAEVS